jgi:hypothetical protein
LTDKRTRKDNEIFGVNHHGLKPGRKFLLSNGIYGILYGIGGAYALNVSESWGLALPFITAGTSLAYPLLNPRKYDGIDFSTVMMTRHGKFIGLLDGAALGFLLYGDISQDEWRGRAFVATMIATSIALGEAGFQIGKKNRLPEGKVSTFRYYSLLLPYLAFSGLVAGNVDDPHVYGATVLASGAASYWYANRVYKKYQFSRGDMLAASSFGLLLTGLGFGISPLEEPWHMLIPAITTLVGTYASHRILKETKFTTRQGWNINYATLVGVIVGFGASLAIQPDSHQITLILPAAAGMLGWGIYTSKYKKQIEQSFRMSRKRWSTMSFSFTPQHYFITKRIIKPSPENLRKSGLPLFSLRLSL